MFKGGTALKKCYFPEYRFSEDLDFTLAEEVPFEKIRAELEVAFTEAYRVSGVIFRYAREKNGDNPHFPCVAFATACCQSAIRTSRIWPCSCLARA